MNKSKKKVTPKKNLKSTRYGKGKFIKSEMLNQGLGEKEYYTYNFNGLLIVVPAKNYLTFLQAS